jgi:hypothetical protein
LKIAELIWAVNKQSDDDLQVSFGVIALALRARKGEKWVRDLIDRGFTAAAEEEKKLIKVVSS